MPTPDNTIPSDLREERPADAVPEQWVERLVPASWLPFVRLSRIDRPIGTWLLLLPCWWGIALALASEPQSLRLETLWLVVSVAIGAVLMRGAGCTWNDYADREFDAAVARTRSRPIPAGQASPRAALVWMVAQALLAACILFTFNVPAILLGIASLALVCIYPFAKRVTWWPQIFLGLAFNWGIPLGWAAQVGHVPPEAWILYLAGIVWTLFYDTIYAHQDKEDDALIGVRSTARLFGSATPLWLLVFLTLTVSLMGVAVILALIEGPPFALVAGLAGVWLFGWHLAGQLRSLDIDDPELCLMLFRSNRDAGLMPALAFAVAAGTAIVL
ncbi:MAG: 4-hydroxybenzoate octaprenyltransferase [Pseudomonadota bacterium]